MMRSKMKLGIGLLALTALLGVAAFTASPAAAGKSGSGGRPSGASASIKLNQADPHLGDAVTFTTSGGSSVTVNCFQGGLGNLVYAARLPVGSTFVLGGGSSAWQSGPATCVVYLYSRDKYLAQTGFEAADAR